MAKRFEVYKCAHCSNIVEVLHNGNGQLVCCGMPMELVKEKTEEEGREKHLPVIERIDIGIKVKVGSVEHPMGDAHYIEWIEVIAGGKAYKKYLNPNDKPEVDFPIMDEQFFVRGYCNVHGLWKVTM